MSIKNVFLCFLVVQLPGMLSAQRSKTVVLTFDDAPSSHYNFVAPLLKKYGFPATFYVCEFPPDYADSSKYMNWRQIQQLSKMGFEIGNHTWHHKNIDGISVNELNQELSYIEQKCDSLGIPKPTTFAYPAYHADSTKLATLRAHGILTARTGSGKYERAYDTKKDGALYIPSFTIAGEDKSHFYDALKEAVKGSVVVFTFHGVPDLPHPWVSTPQAIFEEYMAYLHEHHYHVLAMKSLKRYVH